MNLSSTSERYRAKSEANLKKIFRVMCFLTGADGTRYKILWTELNSYNLHENYRYPDITTSEFEILFKYRGSTSGYRNRYRLTIPDMIFTQTNGKNSRNDNGSEAQSNPITCHDWHIYAIIRFYIRNQFGCGSKNLYLTLTPGIKPTTLISSIYYLLPKLFWEASTYPSWHFNCSECKTETSSHFLLWPQ